jgi:hypothetical protein
MRGVSVINIEETIGKTVGHRGLPNHLCPRIHSIQRAKNWQKSFPIPFPPKGVFRFMTHEEADTWMKINTRVNKS